MRLVLLTVRRLPLLVTAALLAVSLTVVAGAQSQEPKPELPATPVTETGATDAELPLSGVSDSSWQGPNWGVRVTWDPAAWTVEDEFIADGYDGLRIGTPISTVYIEAYEDFGGDAEACLSAAELELSGREGVTEVAPLSNRPLPTADEVRGAAQFYGLTATLDDGTPFRGVEYIECRTLVPGVTVLELTWQTATGAFNEDFPLVEALFAAIEAPDQTDAAATPAAPQATPVA